LKPGDMYLMPWKAATKIKREHRVMHKFHSILWICFHFCREWHAYFYSTTCVL
jgi:hypothetical protein